MTKTKSVRSRNLLKNRARLAALVRCCMEPLESRWLLSGSVLQWSGGLNGNSLYSNETILTPSNVNSSQFGSLDKISLLGGTGDQVYAQPLYVENLTITGQGTNNGTHNVIIVATELNNVYAYDTSTYTLLWKINLGTPIAHGAAGGPNFNNFTATLGVTGTPVIDSGTDTMYLDSTQEPSTGVFIHKIFSINITDGATVNSMTLTGTTLSIPGDSSDGTGTSDPFTPQKELQRPGLTILNGVVYVAYGSYGDTDPYHGWVLGFSENTLTMTAVFDDTPNQIPGGPTGGTEAHDGEGAIWMSGAELTSDGNSLYLVSGNGDFDPDPAYGAFGDSVVKLDVTDTTSSDPAVDGWGLAEGDYFAPSNEATIGNYTIDLDLGTSGAMLLPTQGGAHPNELIMIGKQGVAYLLDQDNLGQFNATTDNVIQEISLNNHGMWGTPTYFNNEIYFQAAGEALEAFSLVNGVMSQEPIAAGSNVISSEGATPVVSSDGTADGIVWVLDNGGNLRAYDAGTLQQLYSLNVGGVEHFAVPVVADGRVYVGGAGTLSVLGEKSTPFGSAPGAPTNLSVSNSLGDQLTLAWTGTAATNETAFLIEQSTDDVHFNQIGTAPVDATSFVDTNVTPGTTYYYRVRAANPMGDSGYSNVVNASAQMYTPAVDLYHFDDGTGSTTADSGTANITGTLTGSVSLPQWTTGYDGGALSFSGDGIYNSGASESAIQVPTSISTTLSATSTMAFWLNTTQTGNNDPSLAPAIMGVSKLSGTVDAGNDVRWGYLDATGHIGISDDGLKTVNNPYDDYGVVSTSPVNDGKWHFIVLTRNTSTGLMQVWVDGVLQASLYGDTGNKTTTYNYIGAQVDENSSGTVVGEDFFNGKIDDLHICNQMLNSTEIALLASLPGSPTNLTAAPASGSSAQIKWTFTPVPGTLGITPNVQIEYRIGNSGTFSPLIAISGTLSSYTITGLTAGTQYQYEIQEIDNAGSSDFTSPAGVTPVFGSIAGRNTFYNDSVFDGFDSAADSGDGGAFATDKTALLPGQTATFANYTSYTDGINGIAIDIANDFGTVTPADFTFTTGNSSDPSSWTAANAPDSMVILPGQGAGASTRIEFVWTNDDAVTNAWLQITVAADMDTNLQSPDVFYFGNAVGETGDSATDANVNATDQIGVRANNASGVSVTDPYDFNRDGNVDATDEAIARNNQTNFTSALQLIAVPAVMNLLPAEENADPLPPDLTTAPADAPGNSLAGLPLSQGQTGSSSGPRSLEPLQINSAFTVAASDLLLFSADPRPQLLTGHASSASPIWRPWLVSQKASAEPALGGSHRLQWVDARAELDPVRISWWWTPLR